MVYHFHIAPVPRLPPDIERVEDCPIWIGETPEIEFGSIELGFTKYALLVQDVVLHFPSALT